MFPFLTKQSGKHIELHQFTLLNIKTAFNGGFVRAHMTSPIINMINGVMKMINLLSPNHWKCRASIYHRKATCGIFIVLYTVAVIF